MVCRYSPSFNELSAKVGFRCGQWWSGRGWSRTWCIRIRSRTAAGLGSLLKTFACTYSRQMACPARLIARLGAFRTCQSVWRICGNYNQWLLLMSHQWTRRQSDGTGGLPKSCKLMPRGKSVNKSEFAGFFSFTYGHVLFDGVWRWDLVFDLGVNLVFPDLCQQ